MSAPFILTFFQIFYGISHFPLNLSVTGYQTQPKLFFRVGPDISLDGNNARKELYIASQHGPVTAQNVFQIVFLHSSRVGVGGNYVKLG